jgi:hypothetical protein
VLWSVLEHGFLKSRKSELQTPPRTGSWDRGLETVWDSFPGAATRLGSGRGLGGVWEAGLGTASQELPRLPPDLPPDRCHGLESATRPDLPGASPCCQVGKSAQVTPTCHGMP